jgi:GAF domain-containing protein
MSGEPHYREAAAVGALASEEAHRALLQSIVDVSRAIFGAKASSDELVFEAVSGEGEEELVGMRLPSSTGIAGWVLVTRQPLMVDDLQQDPRFARQAAEATGYVPHGLMAVPLLIEERAIGVLEVLDRPNETPFSLAETDLLTLFAHQAAIGLDLLQKARRARAALDHGGGRPAQVARIAELLEHSDDRVGGQLLDALEAILRERRDV